MSSEGLRSTPPGSLPLNQRLRAEAAEWDKGEDIVPLLREAAEVIEGIVDAVAQAAVIGAKYSTKGADRG